MSDDRQGLDLLSETVDLAVQYGLDVVGALIILIGGWVAAGWVRRKLLRVLERAPRVDQTLRPVIASVVRYVILVFVLIAVLAQFGVQTTSIIALLAAGGLAIGLALQGTLQNIAAGIMFLFLRPFRVGDYIDAEGLAGTVNEIGLFTTQMRTYDGIYLEVPNAKIWNRAITNYSRVEARRLDLVVGIGYQDDIDKALAAMMDLLGQGRAGQRRPRAAGHGQGTGRQRGQPQPALLDRPRGLLEPALRPDQGDQAAPRRRRHHHPLPAARRAPNPGQELSPERRWLRVGFTPRPAC